MRVWPPKDPDEVAVRYMDWTQHPAWNDGDAITTASFTLSTAAGMTLSDADHDESTLSKVTLSGGTDESRGKVLCAVTTEDGQTLQQTMTILIRAR